MDKTTKQRRAALSAIIEADSAVMEEIQDLETRLEKRRTEHRKMIEAWKVLRPEDDPLLADLFLPYNDDGAPTGAESEGHKNGLGMTKFVREILESHPKTEFTPPEIRDQVARMGMRLEGRSNALSEIHLALKRLARQNPRVMSRQQPGGSKTLWSFHPDPELKILRASAWGTGEEAN